MKIKMKLKLYSPFLFIFSLSLTLFATFVTFASFSSTSSWAKEVEIKMKNKGANGEIMVFEPEVIKIQKGDSVRFTGVDKGHNVMSMDKPNSAPAGAIPWKSLLSQDFVQKFDQEGIHGIICKPHFPMGMVGAIVVGKTTNLSDFKKVQITGPAKKRFDRILKTLSTL